jgi:hypothetical protein
MRSAKSGAAETGRVDKKLIDTPRENVKEGFRGEIKVNKWVGVMRWSKI